MEFYDLCRSGNIKDVARIMEKNDLCDWNGGFYHACCGGNLGVIRLFLQIEAAKIDLEDGFFAVCSSGNLNVIQFFITNAQHLGKLNNCWNYGFFGACQRGHLEVIQFLTEKTKQQIDWNFCLHYACINGHLKVVQFLISKGAND